MNTLPSEFPSLSEDSPLLILVDYKGDFYSSTRHPYVSMDLPRLTAAFSARDIVTEIRGFSDVDLRDPAYSKRIVLYQSSEDLNLHYKGYIEDVLLGLALRDCFLIPRFEYFRAHHNKVFMEMLRDTIAIEAAQNIRSWHFGTLEEFRARMNQRGWPMVIKSAEGATSSGVALARSASDALRGVHRLSRSLNMVDAARDVIKAMLRDYHKRRSNYRRKFVVQSFIPGLSEDFKVLVFGRRYYCLRRKNRENDFRASGSGMFSFPTTPPERVLEYAHAVFSSFDAPFISLDVGSDGRKEYLFEFQFLSFGTYTLERSPRYFWRNENGWQTEESASDLENVFADSVAGYLEACGVTGVRSTPEDAR